MAQRINRLKQADLKRTKPGLVCDGGGLWLRITEGKEGTCRSWVYRYTRDEYTTSTRKDGTTYRRQKDGVVGLGPHPQVSLEAARAAARELDRKRRSGEDRDPAKTRQAEKATRRAEKDEAQAAKDAEESKAPIFDRCIDAFVENNRSRWSVAHYEQVKSSLVRFASPIVGHLPVDQITITHVIAILKPAWQSTAETTSRVRARLQGVLDLGYSLAHPDDHEAAQALVDRNPARASSHLRHILGHNDRTKTSFAAMDYRQVGAFMLKLRAINTASARCLEFLILTASRSMQTVKMTWSEVDFDDALWTISGERMKNGKEHIVPLSGRAMQILKEMPRSGDQVFPVVSRVAMWKLLKSMHPDLSVHGFRSTFKDYCSDMLDVDDLLSETALAHSNSDATWKAYRRKSAVLKRAVLMQQWSDFCAVEFKSNVTPLPVPERAA
jgi:integrase